MNEPVDWEAVEVEDLITFDDGRVLMVRGIIDQEDQWVFQMHDGSDLRVSKNLDELVD